MVTWEEILRKKNVYFEVNGSMKNFDVETFTWEKLDCIEDKSSFKI